MQGLLDSKVTGSGDADLAIEARKLTKRYKNTVAVDGLNLAVQRGGVYGLLGPNGSGKTTTLKMLVGLVETTSGFCRVLGQTPESPGGLSRVGALVESPDFYPYLSGRDNLKVLSRCSGIPSSRAEEVLAQVGLGSQADDAFRKYSLGMKQRLGVASALLKNPELLILDEPANGLDAKGMVEMRTLIRRLAEERRTVLMSSHLMQEVEQLCDRIGVINKGKLTAEGNVSELRRQGGLEVLAEPKEQAAEIAAQVKGVGEVRISGEALWLAADPRIAPDVIHALDSKGVRVMELRQVRLSLEELFLKLTEDGH